MWRTHCKSLSSLRRVCLFGIINIVMLLVVSSFTIQVVRPLQRRLDLSSTLLIHNNIFLPRRSEFQRGIGALSYVRILNSSIIQPHHGQPRLVIPYSGSSSMARYASFTTATSYSLVHESDSSMDVGQIRTLVQEAHDIVQRNVQSLTLTKVQLKV
jgi:hypothetical protein